MYIIQETNSAIKQIRFSLVYYCIISSITVSIQFPYNLIRIAFQKCILTSLLGFFCKEFESFFCLFLRVLDLRHALCVFNYTDHCKKKKYESEIKWQCNKGVSLSETCIIS